MTRFRTIRHLLTLARDLDAEADRMTGRGEAYWARRIAAEEYRARAEHLAGRIDADECNARLCECADARRCPEGE